MSKLEKILALVRSINEDEFQEQLTHGDSLDDVYEELLFLAKKIESKKKRTALIVEQISNCFAGDFFNYLPVSEAQDELDVFCMGFNTYIEELKATLVSKKLIETLNDKLVEEKQRSEKLTINRDEFLSNVGHEIRTPLNAIVGFVDLLLENSMFSNEQKKQLEYIKMSGDILRIIFNDVVDLSKMESGQVAFSNTPFLLKSITQFVKDTFDSSVNDKEIDFRISVDKDLPAVLNGDSIRISQILFNLLNNSINQTPFKGKMRLKIKLHENEDIYWVKFILKDNGVGIPADKSQGVVSSYDQMKNDKTENDVASGIGFSTVNKIVSLMNGKIEAISKVNIGTKVILTLPFSKNDNNLSVSKPSIQQDYSIQKTFDDSRKIRVLLAEDNHTNQILVKKVLSKYNIDCIAVFNGKLAVEAVINEDFDLVIMDLMMPVMNGFEAASEIRSLKDHTKKNIPILALSAVVSSGVVDDCKAVGIDKYISKPFDSEELYNEIMRLI